MRYASATSTRSGFDADPGVDEGARRMSELLRYSTGRTSQDRHVPLPRRISDALDGRAMSSAAGCRSYPA